MDAFREAFRLFNQGLRDAQVTCEQHLVALPWYKFMQRARYDAMSALLLDITGAGKQIWLATEVQRVALEAQDRGDQDQ